MLRISPRVPAHPPTPPPRTSQGTLSMISSPEYLAHYHILLPQTLISHAILYTPIAFRRYPPSWHYVCRLRQYRPFFALQRHPGRQFQPPSQSFAVLPTGQRPSVLVHQLGHIPLHRSTLYEHRRVVWGERGRDVICWQELPWLYRLHEAFAGYFC